MELALKPAFQQPHLVEIERVVDTHLVPLNGRFEDAFVHPVLFQHVTQSIHVLAVVQRLHALGTEEADGGQEGVSQVAELGLE